MTTSPRDLARRAAGVALGFGGLFGLRWLFSRRLVRDSLQRLPIGADGIVRGAETIRLDSPGATRAVLLLHGFGDTPQTMSYLAHALHGREWSVLAPLLPGHGRTVYDFAKSNGAQWLDAARDALDELADRHERVAVVGLSMGGALAIRIAAESPERIAALVLVAPYCDAPRQVRDVARYSLLVSTFIPFVNGRNERSILDADERARSLGYGVTTPRLLGELVRTADAARGALAAVRAPTLILQSRADNRIAPEVAEAVLRDLGSSEKRLEWMSDGGHIITVDRGRERVIDAAGDWLERWIP